MLTETRYRVMAHKNMAARFYGVGEVLIETPDRCLADVAFLDSKKAPDEWITLFAIDTDSPHGRELSCRH